jgi:pyruvate,water dikinase
MVFHGALRELVRRWLRPEHRDIHNELVAGEDDIISLEPVRQMRRLASMAAKDEKLLTRLREGSLDSIRRAMNANPEFERVFAAYVERFGDRCLDELKLESRTLADDPLPCLRAIGQLATRSTPERRPESPRQRAERTVKAALGRAVLKRRALSLVMRLARARVRDRENMRFERTRVYGRVRAVFVEIGRRLETLGVLANADDVFYLHVDEISGAIRGTGISVELAAVVSARRREFEGYEKEADPPRRFRTVGPPQLARSIQAPGTPPQSLADDMRHGQACCQGVVRGQVRIVRDPRQATIQSGEVLVAQRTDPGWVTIFPLVRGMIMERGSLLSHSAIVARELQIPAVVGVQDACDWLQDGDWVELDGGAGTIRRLDNDELAA